MKELGIDRTEAQRAVKIASIAPEAKLAAERADISTQRDWLEVAKAEPAQQVTKVNEIVKKKAKPPKAPSPPLIFRTPKP